MIIIYIIIIVVVFGGVKSVENVSIPFQLFIFAVDKKWITDVFIHRIPVNIPYSGKQILLLERF